MTMLAATPGPCPRCRGRLFTGQDSYGAYSSCLACGFVHELVSGPAIDLLPDPAPGRRRREPSHNGRQL